MPTRAYVDPAEAVRLHRDMGRKVPAIAEHFGVQQPAIYRAFRKQGYFTGNMLENRKPPEPVLFLPPAAKASPRLAARKIDISALPEPVQRDPCFRCGARGDYGCNCNKAPVGWRAG